MSATVVSEKPTDVVEERIEVKPYGALLPADRCDMCCAQAFMRFVHPTIRAHDGLMYQDLLFCGHHGNKVRDTLKGWNVLDETHKINQTPEG